MTLGVSSSTCKSGRSTERPNKWLHLTGIPLRSIPAGEPDVRAET